MDKSRFQEADYLRDDQYKDSRNLEARAQLHQRFGTAKMSWRLWVFNQLGLGAGQTILECGCGPGWLWRGNLDHIPPGCQITLTDLSPGMVAEAEAALDGGEHDFRFQTVDIQSLPFDDGYFDVVVANHMLYHVPDIAQALREVRRVLKPHGRFCAVTNGESHMRELKALRADMLNYVNVLVTGEALTAQLPFRLENGAELLQPYFENVQLIPFEDGLVVNEVVPLVEYAFSATEYHTVLTDDRLSRIRQYVADRMTAAGGALHITKSVGMFVAQKA
ncbi:MAG: class I SAM-dependent methyltransferase [Anaerolineales bacterium]|nr:class I SAM-dependent methyltransferase [Anaerolineales bacterium]MCB8991040.1 class I SAM-dependent methyltransferase [Ardenticatenaceae bacterium]MCB9004085.1 class I SAM-dependent methyltransferase [Ardenticatenaceae bacterium]